MHFCFRHRTSLLLSVKSFPLFTIKSIISVNMDRKFRNCKKALTIFTKKTPKLLKVLYILILTFVFSNILTFLMLWFGTCILRVLVLGINYRKKINNFFIFRKIYKISRSWFVCVITWHWIKNIKLVYLINCLINNNFIDNEFNRISKRNFSKSLVT